MNILQALDDRELFAKWFSDPATGRDASTWAAWRVFLAALFALPMTEEQLEVYKRHTGRDTPPAKPFNEAWLVTGRRGGKSFTMALVAVFLATFRQYRQYLQPGERGTVAVIAADRRQARNILRYVSGLLHDVPMLKRLIEKESREGFDLAGSVTIEVTTASARTSRGFTFVAALCDEIAFWPTDDAAEPDFAVLDAIRPGMATIPGAMLLCASSPYARKGALYAAWRRYFGKDDARVLVWQATTRDMNPVVPEEVIQEAYERDAASASAEYGAQFRTDVEALLTREAVEACVEHGIWERSPVPGIRYLAFVDPSGGSSDSMTLGIAHFEKVTGHAVLDLVREVKPPFSPEAVVDEFCNTMKGYRIGQVTGDRYAGEWAREPFRKHGIDYRISDQTRSELYLSLVPAINSGSIRLLEHQRLEAQLIALERRTSRAGRDTIDHPRGSHDDVANAAAGALCLAGVKPRLIQRVQVVGM